MKEGNENRGSEGLGNLPEVTQQLRSGQFQFSPFLSDTLCLECHAVNWPVSSSQHNSSESPLWARSLL